MLLKVILIVLIVYAIGLANFARGENGRENQQTQFSRGWDNRLRILIIGATGRTSREFDRHWSKAIRLPRWFERRRR